MLITKTLNKVLRFRFVSLEFIVNCTKHTFIMIIHACIAVSPADLPSPHKWNRLLHKFDCTTLCQVSTKEDGIDLLYNFEYSKDLLHNFVSNAAERDIGMDL